MIERQLRWMWVENMDEEFVIDPERALQTIPLVYLGEASRAAASFNQALQRTRRGRCSCNQCVTCAGWLSLGRCTSLKRFTPILFVPVAYALLSACLLLLPLNNWFKLHSWYFVSWPASHLFARESLAVQVEFGCIQWGLIATAWVFLFRRHHARH